MYMCKQWIPGHIFFEGVWFGDKAVCVCVCVFVYRYMYIMVVIMIKRVHHLVSRDPIEAAANLPVPTCVPSQENTRNTVIKDTMREQCVPDLTESWFQIMVGWNGSGTGKVTLELVWWEGGRTLCS